MFAIYASCDGGGVRLVTAFHSETDAEMYVREWALAGRTDLYYVEA